MEQMIIDFFAKASELILHNRLLTSQTWEGMVDKLINPSPLKFQLAFNQKFSFVNKIPLQWSSQANKLLVIEFFLCLKGTDTKILAEQWIFDMNQVSGHKLEHTIDSTSALHKKLSVLLRTISTLSVTLPLYQKFIKDKHGKLPQQYSLEHSINFTRHTLSSWHPRTHEDKDFMEFTGPDFVLPGRTFTFKVNSSKSLKIVQSVAEEFSAQEKENLPWARPRPNSQFIQESIQSSLTELNLMRRAFSDNHFNQEKMEKKVSHPLILYDSPPEVNPWQNNELMSNYSPVGLIPVSLQQGTPVVNHQRDSNPSSRKSSEPRVHDGQKLFGENSRLRVKTLDSESFNEADIFICETDDGKFTEVLSWKEVNMRAKSPTRFHTEQKTTKGMSEHQFFRKISEEFEKSKLRLSLNTKPIEKVIEQSDDDKIAELLLCIEGLKTISRRPSNEAFGMNSGEKNRSEEVEKIKQKGLRFEINTERENPVDERRNPFKELDDLRGLYSEIKRLGATK